MGNLSFNVYFIGLVIFISSFADASGLIGVNYGRVANDLPQPTKVVELLKTQGLNRMKLYDTDESVLKAFSGSGIKVVVALPNELLSSVSKEQSFANQWVKENIFDYYPSTEITAIAVGNEVFVDPKNTTKYLVSAMKNVHTALTKYNLHSKIKVSSPIALSALESSYPSSAGSFKTELIEPVLKPMMDFLRQTGSYLMVNVYPFFAYSANADVISLDYALFHENPGVVDSGNGLRYFNLFDAQVDAVFAAMSALKYNDLKMVVTETGWPSKGDEKEIGAGTQNAEAYNGNLVKRVLTGGGTPLRPNEALDVYLFALFNENQKTGPTSERNYGLFYPTEKKVYSIPLNTEGLKGWTGGKSQSAPVNNGGKDNNGGDGISTSSSGQTWCVANEKSGEKKLQEALDYACGEGGADCHSIQPGSTCYNPNTLEAHASFAFNSYYQKKPWIEKSVSDFVSTIQKTEISAEICTLFRLFRQKSDISTEICQFGHLKNRNFGRSFGRNSRFFNPWKKLRAIGTCSFGGAAYVVTQSPKYGKCEFPTGAGN